MNIAIYPALLADIGRILLAVCFLGTALINSTTLVKQHRDRMADLGVPLPGISLWIGFAMQYVGSIMMLLNFHADIGAAILIVFTIVASAIFHRFWIVPDPLRRHLHRSFLFSNAGVTGGLLLVIAL